MLGAEPREVRTPADLDGLDGLIIPGGESTVMTLGIEREGLARAAARARAAAARPVLGTCAGLIMLDRNHLGLMDILARRNAFGRADPLASRPTWRSTASTVSRCARSSSARRGSTSTAVGSRSSPTVDGHPVAAREEHLLVAAFHPELSDDPRLHELFLARVRERAA